VRNAAYGSLAVVLALLLAKRGLEPSAVGAVLTVALVSGAVFSALAPRLEKAAGRRGALVASSFVMAASGVLLALAHSPLLFVIAAAMGTLSPGGQEVGPFGPLEQASIADLEAHGSAVRRFVRYNVVGTFAAALGALAPTIVSESAVAWGYAGAGVALAVLYSAYRSPMPAPRAHVRAEAPPVRFGAVEKLSALFGLDALAGGFVVQSFIAYWLALRFGVDAGTLGWLFFGANALAALSYLAAAPLAGRIGLLETMVFTHLPSNALLLVVPLMPNFELAAAALLARYALSQMDVPTRQAFTMAVVPRADRARAAGMTNAVRPAAAAVAPLLSGLALQVAAFGLPFFLAGGLKICYDLALYGVFRGSIKRNPIC
jgi:MFS family permease